jgi:hypothetical protein
MSTVLERIEEWRREVSEFGFYVSLWDDLRIGDVAALRSQFPSATIPPGVSPHLITQLSAPWGIESTEVASVAEILIKGFINHRLRLNPARIVLSSESPSLDLVPRSLIGALWAQFGLAVLSGEGGKRCLVCRYWFPGRRSDADFCSARCRQHYQRHGTDDRGRAINREKRRKRQ